MQTTTSRDFVDWMTYLEMEFEVEVRAFHREDYYLAQIAAEVRRSFVKEPEKVCLEDMLLTFESVREDMASPRTEADLIEERTQRSKSYWYGILGVHE